MNLLVRIERWIYIHFGLSLPSWRQYWEWYTETIQEELDAEAKARFFLDSLEDAL